MLTVLILSYFGKEPTRIAMILNTLKSVLSLNNKKFTVLNLYDDRLLRKHILSIIRNTTKMVLPAC